MASASRSARLEPLRDREPEGHRAEANAGPRAEGDRELGRPGVLCGLPELQPRDRCRLGMADEGGPGPAGAERVRDLLAVNRYERGPPQRA